MHTRNAFYIFTSLINTYKNERQQQNNGRKNPDRRRTQKRKTTGSTNCRNKSAHIGRHAEKIALQQERLNTLNKIFSDRERFSKACNEIKRFKTSMHSAIKDQIFESPDFRLVFIEQVNSYKEESHLSVSTPEILLEFLEFIDEKIINKLHQLDANIVAMAA